MMKMQHILENTDLPDLFVSSIEVIMQLSALYPDTLTDYFRVSNLLPQFFFQSSYQKEWSYSSSLF